MRLTRTRPEFMPVTPNILNEMGTSSQTLIDWVADLVGRMEQPEFTADESEIRILASAAAAQWTGRFNPIPLGVEGFVDLYRSAFAMLEPA